MPVRVASAHTASYPDPIELKAGDMVIPDGREELWDGHRWIWARGSCGREGWIPDNLIVARQGRTVAARDYSAVELNGAAGEIVEIIGGTHGWSWRRRANGAEGWLPNRKLTPC